MPAPSDALGPATLAITQSVSSFQFFLPKLSDVRRGDPVHNPDLAGDVRMGEIAAATLCLGIGLMVSSMSGSPYPAMVSLIMVAILIGLYEAALRNDHPMNPPVVRSDDA